MNSSVDVTSKSVNDANHVSASSKTQNSVPTSQPPVVSHPPKEQKRSSLSMEEYRRLHMKPVTKQQPPVGKQHSTAIPKVPVPPRPTPNAVKIEQASPGFINRPKKDESIHNTNHETEGRIKPEKTLGRNESHSKLDYSKPTDSRRHHDKGGGAFKELQHPVDSKKLQDLYQKRRDKLWSILRHRLQYFPDSVNNEEKMYYQKLDENRKRKHAEAQKIKAVQPENTNGVTSSPSNEHGSLKLKIRVGPPPDGHPLKTSNTGSSSGSDYSSPARPRKRGHHNDITQPDAKLYKRSDEHRHHSNNGSPAIQHSKQRHKQSRSSHHPSKPKSTVDDSIFQKSLSDAISKVQQSGGSIPSNVKSQRPINGGSQFYSGRNSHSNQQRPMFDPSTPVSARMPDNIFEDDHHEVSSDSLEPGEIMDNVRNSSYPSASHYNKKLNKRIKPTIQ